MKLTLDLTSRQRGCLRAAIEAGLSERPLDVNLLGLSSLLLWSGRKWAEGHALQLVLAPGEAVALREVVEAEAMRQSRARRLDRAVVAVQLLEKLYEGGLKL